MLSFKPKDNSNPTSVEAALVDVVEAFRQLQKDRHRADYDMEWDIVETEVAEAIALAAETFVTWRSIRTEDVARHHLLSMFGAKLWD